MNRITPLLIASLMLASPAVARGPAPGANIAAALASPTRPDADKARDAVRKPAELLAFAGVKAGDSVIDFIMGGGYLTRILAGAVGPKGHVYAYQPAEFVKFKASYGTDQDGVVAANPNVTAVRVPLSEFVAPGKADVAITVQNYHDMHLGIFAPDAAAKANAALFAALKPGGTLIVVDHVALAGSGMDAPNKLHRIDPAIVRAELEKAGFRYDGALMTWRDAADPHTANVFDPAIRGKTDQFAFRFRKPR